MHFRLVVDHGPGPNACTYEGGWSLVTVTVLHSSVHSNACLILISLQAYIETDNTQQYTSLQFMCCRTSSFGCLGIVPGCWLDKFRFRWLRQLSLAGRFTHCLLRCVMLHLCFSSALVNFHLYRLYC